MLTLRPRDAPRRADLPELRVEPGPRLAAMRFRWPELAGGPFDREVPLG